MDTTISKVGEAAETLRHFAEVKGLDAKTVLINNCQPKVGAEPRFRVCFMEGASADLYLDLTPRALVLLAEAVETLDYRCCCFR